MTEDAPPHIPSPHGLHAAAGLAAAGRAPAARAGRWRSAPRTDARRRLAHCRTAWRARVV